MSAPVDCPEIECWQAWLGDDVAPEQRESQERHLESCTFCQERLHRADSCDDAIRSLARRGGDPTATQPDPTLIHIIERLCHSKCPETWSPADAPDLYFLQPSDRSELLGTLGDYEVQEVIGQGGMGVVLKAFDPGLHR